MQGGGQTHCQGSEVGIWAKRQADNVRLGAEPTYRLFYRSRAIVVSDGISNRAKSDDCIKHRVKPCIVQERSKDAQLVLYTNPRQLSGRTSNLFRMWSTSSSRAA